MKIKENIKSILLSGYFDGSKYQLPQGQLDRKVYVECNSILETIGLKWSRKEKLHIGDNEDACDILEEILENGELETLKEYRDRFQFFPTPTSLAEYMVNILDIQDDDTILEPSAGKGAILDAIRRKNQNPIVTAIELNEDFIPFVRDLADKTIQKDFLEYDAKNYSKIIMNPPYSKRQDYKHTKHAINLLNDGGILVGLMSRGILFREDYKDLKEDIIEHGYIDEVKEGTFKESGTMVGTCLIVYKK